MLSSRAIVLSRFKYQDTGLIVKCFTQQAGMQSYLLKGVLSSKKNKNLVAYFQPLSLLEMVATHNPNKSFQYVKEVRFAYLYKDLHQNPVKNAVVYFLAEIALAILQEEVANPELFSFWESHLHWYDTAQNSANFHLKFLLDLTQYLGFFPDASQNDSFFLDLEEGVFTDQNSGNHTLGQAPSQLIKTLINNSLEDCCALKLSRQQRNELLEALLEYYAWHLPNFHRPRSWEILREIFN